jgi:hypothetical protein
MVHVHVHTSNTQMTSDSVDRHVALMTPLLCLCACVPVCGTVKDAGWHVGHLLQQRCLSSLASCDSAKRYLN